MIRILSLTYVCLLLLVRISASPDGVHLACKILAAGDSSSCEDSVDRVCQAMAQRVIVIGDVHGDYDGLLQLLHSSNITSFRDSCEWASQGASGTILLQIGDIVDRGDKALEAWECLNGLQASAPVGSKVVRILGNHELWWLQGHYHMRNPEADTRVKVERIVLDLKSGILNGHQHAAYVHTINDISILFIHAGLRPDMEIHMKKLLGKNYTAHAVAHHMNKVLLEHTERCIGFPVACPYNDEVFEAGPDRGGKGIGGPLWTDFSVLEKADESGLLSTDFLQVVGHSVAECYRNYMGEEAHPPETSAGCHKGLVRKTKNMNAVCVDGGMYLGARTFLEISPTGEFWTYEYNIHGRDDASEWIMRNLNAEVCLSSVGQTV